MQHEITTAHPLLDREGKLMEPGYTKGLLLDYDRGAIKAKNFRIKEWDYYLITTDAFGVALTIADNSYMGLDSISLLDFSAPGEHTKSEMAFFTGGKKNLPPSSKEGSITSEKKTGKNKYMLDFKHNGDHRILTFFMDNFHSGKPIKGQIRLENPSQESMVIATPFAGKPTAFYYNQKINCLPATGKVEFDGKTYEFEPGKSFGVLDWGRGVWTYKNTWYWGSASGSVEGVPFGFNIGYGFGDTSAASENMVFYNGKAHKLSQVTFNIPLKKKNAKDGPLIEDYMSPWTFSSDDGRFEMDFMPIIDRCAITDFGVLCSNQHQVFGKFTGKVVLDDGETLHISDFLGFAEKVFNKW